MRRLWACLLLLCVGLALPAAGGPMRVCLAPWIPAAEERSCCCEDDCHGDEKDPCCVELASLPDAPQPAPQPAVPPVPVTDLLECAPWIPLETRVEPELSAPRVRGPAPPSVRRAMLAIWRL